MSKLMIWSNPATAAVRGATDNASGRSGQDGVLALEARRVGQPAARVHKMEAHALELRRNLVNVAAQYPREVGVNHRGVAARSGATARLPGGWPGGWPKPS